MSEDLIFSLKKVASIYLNPVTIGLEIIVIGIALIIFSRRKPRKEPRPWWRRLKRIAGDLGLFFTFFGVFAIYMFSIQPVADSMVYALEKKFQPISNLDSPALAVRLGAEPKHVVVLAGGARYHEKKPSTSQLSPATTARILEGVRIHRRFPEATFIVTGRPSETKGMAVLAAEFGVDSEMIIQETESRDTKDHPIYLETLLQGDPFVLVTSATHMPRSYALFEKHGFTPIPAPCDFWVWPNYKSFDSSDPDLFVPRIAHLYKTDIAFHEYLGLAWAKVRKQINEREDGAESDKSKGDEDSLPPLDSGGPIFEI